MTNEDAFEAIWSFGKPKTGDWRGSTWPVVKTTRKSLRKRFDACLKDVKDLQKWVLTVELALKAQQKDRQLARKTGGFMEQPIMYERWLNEERWTMEIVSSQERRDKAESKKCHCGADFPCDKHFYDTLKDDWRKQDIIEEWNKLGCPRTQADCIEVLRQAGKLNLLLILKRPPGKRSATITKLGDT